MKKSIIFGLLSLLLLNVYAQKKDSEAWKAEKQLESQFSVFKSNASYWDGFFMYKEPQLNEFHKVIMDTVFSLEKTISANKNEIKKLNTEISSLTVQLSETKVSLAESLEKETTLVTLGISFNKNAFPPLVYGVIILLTLVMLVAFFLFFRSNVVTKETERRFTDLTSKLDLQKKNGLEREMKLNRELQTERNKNNPSF